MRTAVALGSNLGDRLRNLRAALQQISGLTDIQPPVLSSAIYETDPVDFEPEAPKFLNAVVEFGYNGDPVQLLKKLKSVEDALAGRANMRGPFLARSTSISSTSATRELTTENWNYRTRGCT